MFRESLPTMRAIKVAVGDVLNIFTGCEKYMSVLSTFISSKMPSLNCRKTPFYIICFPYSSLTGVVSLYG